MIDVNRKWTFNNFPETTNLSDSLFPHDATNIQISFTTSFSIIISIILMQISLEN